MIATAALAFVLLGSTPDITPASHPVAEEPAKNAISQTVRQKVERQARDWIALVDAGQWEESWQKAAPNFRDAVTAQEWASQVEPVRKPLGAVVSRQLKGITAYDKLPGAPAGEYLIVQFDTNYAAIPGAVETVVLSKTGGNWGVTGYFIK